MPLLPRHRLETILAGLPAEQTDLVLRENLVPLDGGNAQQGFAAVTADARRRAEVNGYRVRARISRQDFRNATRKVLGPQLVHHAVASLARQAPCYSAERRFTGAQKVWVVVFFALLVAAVWSSGPYMMLTAASILATPFFLGIVFLRVRCLFAPRRRAAWPHAWLSDEELPVYSVLVPVFREIPVLEQLITALLAIDYPLGKLDIKLILEEKDWAMRKAVAALNLPDHFDIVVVPEGNPQTKPRALNYALNFARGSLVTIYDSEDVPEPWQLLQAANRFAHEAPEVACLQAALTFYNPEDNWLARQFNAEYAGLFRVVLPALARFGLPLPLGGTSNHFRIEALTEAGAWDPYNVTEDADLGIRLARFGYKTGVLASATEEEANLQFWNWIRQRRRWMKGFLHTWLVHMRSPQALRKELGSRGFWAAQAMTLGVFASALFHPALLVHGLWCLTPAWLAAISASPLGEALAAIDALLLISGYAASAAIAAAGLKRQGQRMKWSMLFGIPAYWFMLSMAAWMALWDFAVKPHYWHKTNHGLCTRFKRS